MFQALLQSTQRALDSTIAKFVGRAAVAVPLLVAAAFGTAALTIALSQSYGQVTAYIVMAGFFTLIAGVTAAIVSRNGAPAEEPAKESPSVAESVAEVAEPLLNRDTLISALTTAGPIALPAVLRAAARNIPLLVAAFFLALLYLGRPGEEASENSGVAAADQEAQAPPVT